MKAETVLCFLLLALAIAHGAAATPDPDAVLDTANDKLRAGTDYYILPVVGGGGGGLTLGSTSNRTCPLDVVQDELEEAQGLPLKFSPVNPKKGVIRVSTDLNIKFSVVTICPESTVWKLDEYDELTAQLFVTTGGVEGNPGRRTTGNWFKIEKYGDDYKLRFCPSVCRFCKVICKDVGIYIDEDGKRLLALSDVPLAVMFKKA